MYHQKLFWIFLITILQANILFSFEFEYTSQSTDMMTFFQDEVVAYMNILNNGQGVPFYYSASGNLLVEQEQLELPFFSNVTGGSFIRLNKYFLFPINATVSYSSTFDIEGLNLLFSGGLVFQNKIGTIGLFAGYNYHSYKERGEYTEGGIIDGVWHDGGYFNPIENIDETVKFLFVPIINTREFPIIGVVLKTLESAINADQNNEINYSFKLVSQPFKIGGLTFSSIKPYYIQRRFNSYMQTKLNMYGLITNFEMPNGFNFFIDAGYKDYFDVDSKSSFYEDTVYVRWGFPFLYNPRYKDIWLGLTSYADKQFPLPKIGYIAQFRNCRLLVDFGFYKHFDLTFSGRLNYGDLVYLINLIKHGRNEEI